MGISITRLRSGERRHALRPAPARLPVRTGAFALTAIALALSSGHARAAYAAGEPTVDDLDQRIKVLERQLEIQKEEADAKAKDATTASASDKGFGFKKGDYSINFKALAQVDGRFFLSDGPTDDQPNAQRFPDGFRLRRLRPTIDGTLGKLVYFRFTPEFAGDGSGLGFSNQASNSGNGSAASIVDAYIDLKFDPAASLRVGKQKGPVGLERLQSGGALTFVERGYVTELVPNRDIGVNLFGELLGGTTNYAVGIFNGTRDGRDIDAADTDNRHEIEARIFVEPFKNSPGLLQGLGVGIAGSDGGQRAAAPGVLTLPQYRATDQNAFFSYLATAQPDHGHTRWTPQAYWYYNSLGFLGEYGESRQRVRNTVTTGTGASAVTTVSDGRFTNDAFNVTLSYVLTGEDASFKGVTKPGSPFNPGGGGWGAVEVAARYGHLDVDNDIFARGFANPNASASSASTWDVGVNWYLTANIKVQLDYDDTTFHGGAAGGDDRHAEHAILSRLQLNY